MLHSFITVTAAVIAGQSLETSAGQPAQLAALLKKPTVIFYEDRDSTALNQHVKDALYEQGKEMGLLDDVSVIAVANVQSYNWFPARNFVLKAVRDIEAKVGIPVYLDFEGGMTQAPLKLSAQSSTVIVMTPTNTEPLKRYEGRLSASNLEELLATLGSLAKK